MKISSYILLLKDMQEEHGDLDMMHTSLDGVVRPSPPPKINHMAILTEKQTKAKFWHGGLPVERKGEKVVEV